MKRLLAIFALLFAFATPALAANPTEPDAWGRQVPLQEPPYSHAATYLWYALGYSAYATPTDLACVWGSATTTVRVTNMTILIGSTSAVLQNIYFIKRKTADSGGTPTSLTGIPVDSADPAPTGTVITYGAAPTTGMAVGTIEDNIGSSAVLTDAPTSFTPYFLNESNNMANGVSHFKPINLHGTNEGVCINYNGASLTSGFSAELKFETEEF
jgi:hypothetical protein